MKKFPQAVVIVAILFVTGITFSNAFVAQRNKFKMGAPIVLGDEEEKSNGDSVDSKNEEQDNSDEKSTEQEIKKTTTEVRRTRAAVRTVAGQKTGDEEGDNEENDNENSDGQENENGNDNGIQGDLSDLKRSIARVEARINTLVAAGVTVDSLKTELATVKDLANQAEAAVNAKAADAEVLIENADHRLERVQKLVEIALGGEESDGQDKEDGSDATEKTQELASEITQVEAKISAAAAAGKDVSVLTAGMAEIKTLFAQAQQKVTAGDLVGAQATAKLADKKLEILKHKVEILLENENNIGSDVAKEYGSEVARFVHNLKTVAELDGGIGKQVSAVAQAQNDSQAKVENSIKEVEGRSALAKFLFGPKYGSIAQIKDAIMQNESRIKTLTDAMNQIADPMVKQVLQEQITMLQQENVRLQNFVTQNESGTSLFGWFTKLFS